jgi:ubiquitin carboxyl-terminal hydrolase 7
LFPKGNTGIPANEWLAIYLDYASSSWNACAQFALVLSNPEDPTNFLVQRRMFLRVDITQSFTHPPDNHHRFVPDERDWGFTKFSGIRALFQPTESRGRPIIENGSTIVTVFLRVLKDPTGLLWLYPSPYFYLLLTSVLWLR